MNTNVFVNRTLNMKRIKYIGLDMDHTLIRYHTRNFETLVYDFVIEELVTRHHYPAVIKTFTFNFDHAIRGLIIDSKHGNILKLGRYASIRQSAHGTAPIDFKEQKQFYRTAYIDLRDPNYMAIDTSFSIAFCVLYAQLVDLKDEFPHLLPDYNQIAKDTLKSVDSVHADGIMKNKICEDMDKYVIQDADVVKNLRRYQLYGKKFFILTNSDYYYTNKLLSHTINPFLDPGMHWSDLFAYVITLARKPRFFYDDINFLTIDPLTRTMTNSINPPAPGIYQGGSAKQFTTALGIREDEILYVGDHIYGDILRIKKDCNWRTALVVEELGAEIAAQTLAHPIERKIDNNMRKKERLEADYIHYNSQIIEGTTNPNPKKQQKLQNRIRDLDKIITDLIQTEKKFYNPVWERIFRAGAEETFFAAQVERFACIYMEKLSDLLTYPPLTYFRARRRLLAHDKE